MKTLLGLAAHPVLAAATRYRLEAHREALRARGIELVIVPFFNDAQSANFHRAGGAVKKATMMMQAALAEVVALVRAGRVDGVFVQREASMIGPPIVEALYAMTGRVPLFFDFDDAVWLSQAAGSRHPIAAALLKAPWKTPFLAKRAAHVIVGAKTLADYASQFSSNVTISPTVVPASSWTPAPQRANGALIHEDAPVLGWIGTFSTAYQLEIVLPALRRLAEEGVAFRTRIIGADERFKLDGVPFETRPWNLATEVEDFRDLDIGLAPMSSTPWSEGKCAFKQVQYMAVGVPFVSSHVGGARELVRHEDNGLVAHTADDWYVALKRLLTDRELRARLSRSGRHDVERELCTEVQSAIVADIVARTM